MNLFRILFGGVILLFSCSRLIAQESEPTNIVFIFCDDLNVSGLGSSFNPLVDTPSLDSLVSEGIVFSNAFSNSPICGPSRASVMTGIHPITSGHYGYLMGVNSWEDNPILSPATNIFDHFKNNGYDVFGTGKIYHGPRTPPESFTHLNTRPNQGPYPFEKRTHSDLPFNFSSENISFSPLENIPSYPEYTGWTKRDGSEFVFNSSNDRDLLGDEMSSAYCDSIFSNWSAGDNPFFLTVGIFNPHEPFHVPQEFFDRYDPDSLLSDHIISDCELSVIAEYANRWNSNTNYSAFDTLIEAGLENADPFYWLKKYIQGYYASVSYVDAEIGKIFNSLKENQLDQNTVVVISSDHGFYLGKNCSVRKTSLNANAAKIPLIINGPDIDSVVVETLVDLYPTFCEFADLPLPEGQLDGNSLLPVVYESVENTAFISVASEEFVFPGNPGTAEYQHHGVAFEDYKLNLYSSGEYELFDLSVDPLERTDISKISDNFSIVKRGFELLKEQIPALTDLAKPWQRMFYGDFSFETEGWETQNSVALETIIADSVTLKLLKMNPNEAIATNQNVLFKTAGEHILTLKLFTEGSENINSKIFNSSLSILDTLLGLNPGLNEIHIPFDVSDIQTGHPIKLELANPDNGFIYLIESQILDNQFLLELVNLCEQSEIISSNSLWNSIDSIPFENLISSISNPGSHPYTFGSILQFTPEDSIAIIEFRSSALSDLSVGIFSSCNPTIEQVSYFNDRTDNIEQKTLENLDPGETYFALVEDLSEVENAKVQSAFLTIPRPTIQSIESSAGTWQITLSPDEMQNFIPDTTIFKVNLSSGGSWKLKLAFTEEGIYSGDLPSASVLSNIVSISSAYQFGNQNEYLFGNNYSLVNIDGSKRITPTLLMNPFDKNLSVLPVQFLSVTEKVISRLTLFDSTGKMVYNENWKPQGNYIENIPVDFSQIPAGLYVVKISTNDTRWSSKLVIH